MCNRDSLLTCVDQFTDIPGGDVFTCDPDEYGNLDTSADFYTKMVDGQKKQRESADKYKTNRRAEKKVQKDIYGQYNWVNFPIVYNYKYVSTLISKLL